MEYREDLKRKSWHELYERFIAADKANGDYVQKVFALQTELRAAQDSLAKLEAKKEAEPLPAWTPPRSLPDGIYKFAGGALQMSSPTFGSILFGSKFSSTRAIFRDWTDPAPGSWRVENGTATWLGES